MPRRFLFGPVATEFAEDNQRRPPPGSDCITFGDRGAANLIIKPDDTWSTICAQLPPGWQPGGVILYLPYTAIPAALWSAPVPVIGWAADWSMLWHNYRHILRYCDLILTDVPGVDVFGLEGIGHARSANLFACQRDFFEKFAPGDSRDIDILFVGNLNPSVHLDRLPWLARLARMGRRWRVAIHSGVYGADYLALLARARIVFNRSVRSECNLRVFEAAAAGALLFMEAGNRELPTYFDDRRHCVFYDSENLEVLLDHYLENEEERHSLAEAARSRTRQYLFETAWEDILRMIEQEWPALTKRAGLRAGPAQAEILETQLWQSMNAHLAPTLIPNLQTALASQPTNASLHNLLGLAAGRAHWRGGAPEMAARAAVDHFRNAVACDPDHVLARLNLAEALAICGEKHLAAEACREGLRALERVVELEIAPLDAPHFPFGWDSFRLEWERAAWAHAGQPAGEIAAKRALLRWRLHALLASLTGDLAHHRTAAELRDDLPVTQAAFGQALFAVGQVVESIVPLRRAVERNPFDLAAARTLFEALGTTGDLNAQALLTQDRYLLARAAPHVVPMEPWFVSAGGAE